MYNGNIFLVVKNKCPLLYIILGYILSIVIIRLLSVNKGAVRNKRLFYTVINFAIFISKELMKYYCRDLFFKTFPKFIANLETEANLVKLYFSKTNFLLKHKISFVSVYILIETFGNKYAKNLFAKLWT